MIVVNGIKVLKSIDKIGLACIVLFDSTVNVPGEVGSKAGSHRVG